MYVLSFIQFKWAWALYMRFTYLVYSSGNFSSSPAVNVVLDCFPHKIYRKNKPKHIVFNLDWDSVTSADMSIVVEVPYC